MFPSRLFIFLRFISLRFLLFVGQKGQPEVRELQLDSMWDEASPQISTVLQNTTEFPNDIVPFDAASDIPIDDQK